jgi:hypothetical protein
MPEGKNQYVLYKVKIFVFRILNLLQCHGIGRLLIISSLSLVASWQIEITQLAK